MGTYYRKLRKKLIERLGGECWECGAKPEDEAEDPESKITFHHIIPLNGNRPNGGLNQLLEIKKNINNVALLCVRCHKKEHGMDNEEHPYYGK